VDPQTGNQSVILFDGVCNLCNGFVNFIIDRDKEVRFRFAALQSETGKDFLKQYGIEYVAPETILLAKNGQIFKKSRAILEISGQLNGIWKTIYFLRFIPSSVLDFFYDVVARNRYRVFGFKDQCRLPTDEIKDHFL
jgi:predicted DCC family thiol-disulfide oxidoreductase YuxK